MKKSIVVLLLIISASAFSQTKKEILVQKWKLDKVEEFGEQFPPVENQKNDWINFSNDGTFSGIIESNHVEGKWSINGDKTILSVNKTLSKTKINWIKSVTVEKDKFSFQYQNGDLITATLVFIPNE